MPKFYITTAIDYPNSLPHIGTAFEKIGADVVARFKRMMGFDVLFLMGNDEHSLNILKRANELNLPTQEYCDSMVEKFKEAWDKLNISYDYFIQTTSKEHCRAVNEIFNRIYDNGDIYKGVYAGKYCVHCESYIKDSDLVNGKCPNHNIEPDEIKEDNYFFKLAKYEKVLSDYITENPGFIEPESRRNEVMGILNQGLEDISISREGGQWGVPLPCDNSHTIYVWFDALINYITGVGFPEDDERFGKYWPADVHVIGKDIIRFHCVIWPAMLLSAGIELPKKVFAHGFVYVKGAKMSKTLGTVVDPVNVVDKLGADGLRYFLLRENPFGGDGDFSWSKMINKFNSDLANDLGNLVHRTLNMAEKYLNGVVSKTEYGDLNNSDKSLINNANALFEKIAPMIEQFKFREALIVIWDFIRQLNVYIEESAPWKIKKEGDIERLEFVLFNCVESIRIIAFVIKPFIPETSSKILSKLQIDDEGEQVSITKAVQWSGFSDSFNVIKGDPIFPKIEIEDEE